MMTRRLKDSLRPLTDDERQTLDRVSRAGSERADRVARAKALLAVADGASFTAAARRAGRRAGDGVAQLVARFNRSGLSALDAQHGGGATTQYGVTERDRILRELQRPPDRDQDGTATWSLTTLQRALRRAPDGLPSVSTWTILTTLHEAGYTFQRDRTWCHTGTATRPRKDGTRVAVIDPETTPKKS
ncbi:MAG TPA: hypothetical protein VHH13_13720 [Arthrobacter sp.]|nr:hypothetical protein [Arthrobacter sp.]